MDSNIGKKYNHWTIVDGAFRGKYHQIQYLCECDCEKKTRKIVDWQTIKRGKSKSCGCVRKKELSERSSTHKSSNTRIYGVWSGMKSRCYCVGNSEYANYGGRGITVCDEWLHDFPAFQKWAIENGYDENAEYGKCTLDRIDVNGNYEPSNCRWVGADVQTRNTRSNVFITYKGVTKRLMDWADEYNISPSVLRDRVRNGCDIEKIFEPKQEHCYVTYNGETHNVGEWAKILGINYNTAAGRYRKGLKPEEILSTTKLKRTVKK